MKTLRVLMVINADGIGGVERVVSILLPVLREHLGACDVAALRATGTPGFLGKEQIELMNPPSKWGPARRLNQLQQLRALASRKQYDILVGFGPSPNALVALARGRRGPRVILTEPGYVFTQKRHLWNQTFMWLYRRADMLVVNTQRLSDRLASVSRRPRKIRVLPNPVSPEICMEDRAGPREKVIATVGRLTPVKRCQDLIEAFADLGTTADGWRLLVIGDGRERQRLEELAQRRGLGERAKFRGVEREPWKLLRQASIFVLCSEREGFGNVLLESMAAGCPIVSSDCPYGPGEIIEEGVTGRLYPPGDVACLTRVLRELIEDPDGRLKLAQSGAQRLSQFAIHEVAREWLSLFEEVTARDV